VTAKRHLRQGQQAAVNGQSAPERICAAAKSVRSIAQYYEGRSGPLPLEGQSRDLIHPLPLPDKRIGINERYRKDVIEGSPPARSANRTHGVPARRSMMNATHNLPMPPALALTAVELRNHVLRMLHW